MDSSEIEKAKAHTITELIDYVRHSVVAKTILKKDTGNINIIAFDNAERLPEKITPFDTYAQIIEGEAEIVISGKSHGMVQGQSIIIPAHAPYSIKSNGRFKMVLTIIKSGYEGVSPAIV